MGNSFIFIVIIIAIIGSIIGSLSKSSNKTNKKNNTTTPIQTRPSAYQGAGGLDLASEIKSKNPQQIKDRTAFQKEADRIAKQKDEHMHPSSKGNIKVEKVFVEESMGKNLSEGCDEHYYERYIKIDKEAQNKGVNQELAKIIVMGEVLNNPGYKKYRRK